jgi:hypothetical protein
MRFPATLLLMASLLGGCSSGVPGATVPVRDGKSALQAVASVTTPPASIGVGQGALVPPGGQRGVGTRRVDNVPQRPSEAPAAIARFVAP